MEQEDRHSALVSVVLPVYNGERHIAEAMESILAQTWKALEVVAIDDGSTDESPSLLRAYARRDERVRVISRANCGLVASLNEALNEAQGEFVARMDADDIAAPTRIERQVKYLQETSPCVAVGCSVLWIDPDGDPIQPMPAVPSHDQITEILMRGRGGICHPSVLFRKEAAEAAGGYRSEYEYAEDIDFFLRLGEYGQLANLQECLLKYRQHSDSISASRYAMQKERAQAAVTQACVRRKMTPRDTTRYYPPTRTEAELHRFWSGLARKAGFMRTARKHGLLAVRKSPLSMRAWAGLVVSLGPNAAVRKAAAVSAIP